MTGPPARRLRRELGPTAWAVLADMVDDAGPDDAGRLVAQTSVRRLAENLGVSKDTAARSLRRLAAAGLVEPLRAQRGRDGRFAYGSYVVCHPQAAPVRRAASRRDQAPRPASNGQASLFEPS